MQWNTAEGRGGGNLGGSGGGLEYKEEKKGEEEGKEKEGSISSPFHFKGKKG
jgi:hypothetical protein